MQEPIKLGLFVSLVLVSIGVALLIAPAESLLKVDMRTGYWIYKNTLKSSGDKGKAIQAARIFYRIFGLVVTVWGLLLLCYCVYGLLT